MIFKYWDEEKRDFQTILTGNKCVKDIKIVEIFNHSFWKKKDVWNFGESNCSELPERNTMVGIAKFCQKKNGILLPKCSFDR